MKSLSRASRDTFSGLVKPAVLGAIGFAIAFVGYAIWLGWDNAMAEFQIWWISALGSGGAVFLLFLWNLACAPFRVERDLRIEAEREIERLRSSIPNVAARRLDGEQKAKITDVIRKSGVRPESIHVVYFDASEECATFAEDLGDAISDVPIKSEVHNGVFFSHNPKDRGLKMIVPHSVV